MRADTPAYDKSSHMMGVAIAVTLAMIVDSAIFFCVLKQLATLFLHKQLANHNN